MEDHKRQQALDALRNALGRLEQSDFDIHYFVGEYEFAIYIKDATVNPEDIHVFLATISNHTLRLKSPK